MKKTLMALGLALCTSLVFAQMPAKKATRASLESNGVEKVAKIDDSYQNEATFKGSIFTKTEVFKTVDFSNTSDYTVGTMGANSYSPQHTQNKGYAQWFRLDDTSAASCAAAATANQATVLFSRNWFPTLDFFTSATPDSGLMAMSMIDYINEYDEGTFNSYIQINDINTTVDDGSQFALDLKLFQYYQKFNADVCCIDYSTNNGQSWDTLEFNIKNIEVAVNDGTFGWKRVALPISLSNQADLDLRIRWYSASFDGGTYGYYWFIDDVTVESAADSRISVTKEEYYNGAYHLVPQGMNLNTLVWYALYRNTGLIPQTNIQGYVKDANTGAEIAATAVDPVINPDVYTFHYSFVDQSNNVNNTSGDQSVTGLGLSGTVNSYASEEGVHDIYSGMRSDSSDFVFDTVRYTVLKAEEDGTRVWGRDNGILTQYSSWIHGLTATGYLTDEANYIDAGYSVNIVLNSGSQVPEGWVIRGVEYVASTDPNLVSASEVAGGDIKINPTLSFDSMDGQYIYFRSIETGAGVHTVTSDEIMLAKDTNTNYFMPGQYRTIRVMFPEQPELKVNTAYRVGYELAEQGYFCLASDANRYWDTYSGADTAVYYYEDENLAPYYNRFGNGYYLNVRVYTPEAGGATWFGTSAGKDAPMIRLLVGPRQEIEKHAINITVDDTTKGYIYSGSTYEVCLGIDSVANGGSRTYLVDPNPNFEVETIQLDGVAQDLYGENPSYYAEGGYYIYTLENITAPHTLHATFKGVGLNAVEDNVKVSLQPNPANAQTKLAIEGVNGEVNFTLIDMSGRVISSEVINANEVKTINVSGLAKGTYFVRLTNSNFSKVEKLIVR